MISEHASQLQNMLDPEPGPPIRCDSTLSVIKIQPLAREKRGGMPQVTQKFSDPEIESLYQLHSTNRKRSELFRCFLYSLLFYCLAHIFIFSGWYLYPENREGYGFGFDPHEHLKLQEFHESDHIKIMELNSRSPHPHPHGGEFNHQQKSSGPHPPIFIHHELKPSNFHLNASDIHSTVVLHHSDKHHSKAPNQGHFFAHTRSALHGPRTHDRSTRKSHLSHPGRHPIYINDQQLGQYPSINNNDPLDTEVELQERPESHPLFYHKAHEHDKVHKYQEKHPEGDEHEEEQMNYENNSDESDSSPIYIQEEDEERTEESPPVNSVEIEEPIVLALVGLSIEEKSDRDSSYVCTMITLMSITAILVLIMLIPLSRNCFANPHLAVILWGILIFLSIILRRDESMPLRNGIGWIILMTFLIWLTLPIRLRSVIFYTLALAIVHSVTVVCRGKGQYLLGRQLGGNLILLAGTNIIGILCYYLSDKKQRRAFIDTRQSLEMKLVIEEQANEQEKLLLSVLPEHLAIKMRQDLGLTTDCQFKKIYMSRHENVSILYADIVGFTAISSTYCASDLVKILNELFARFDKLAEKYHQIRIKILGDCYYCICGAPEERADHGIQCVLMGQSMVKAIKYVRESTKSPVDMRVGIHTGAILAGVLGQNRWQFDIYSKDVELANKMESSGMPGRVHVSEKTLSYLNDEFEVEPAHGEKREEMLRNAGIKTYFIVRHKKANGKSGNGEKAENGEIHEKDETATPILNEMNSTYIEDSTSAVEENSTSRKDTELEYRKRLKEELISRDGYKDLSHQSHWLWLWFSDKGKESEFVVHKEPYAGVTSLACPIALVSFTLATFFVMSFTLFALLTAIIGITLLLFGSALSACDTTNQNKSRISKLSIFNQICSLDSKLWVRRVVDVLTILILTASNLVFICPCMEAGKTCENSTMEETQHYGSVDPPLVLPTSAKPFSSLGCPFPAYMAFFCTLLLLSVTLLSALGFWLKSIAILLVLVLHGAIITLNPFKKILDCGEKFSYLGEYDLIPEKCYLLAFIIVVFCCLTSLNRRLEKSSRVLFLWKTEVEQQRECATVLKNNNEQLVYNILPQHVAIHFLGNRRRKHEELYSQSYSEVGVLFASMPNFSDFYSEDDVNNQGLECLRFLNEVISDFDALLESPKFCESIIKIKTIGSTYMASSGLNPLKQAKKEDPIKIRMAHLELLVEFAFELKRALTQINEQSFNHFVLKMGINFGPITAGVIGARKPHYDIWGNSVNVASRMESTGKAGCIQVTEETFRILRIYGYLFEQRGMVNVKGKGQLMTYYLIGKGPELNKDEEKKFIDEIPQMASIDIP